jgi:hypothetical protein
VFAKINKRYVNRKIYLDKKNQNNCIFVFNKSTKEFLETWKSFLLHLKKISSFIAGVQTSCYYILPCLF